MSKKCRDFEIVVKGHSMSLKVVPFDRLCVDSYWRSLVNLSVKGTVFEIFEFKNAVTLKTGLGVTQGHRHAVYVSFSDSSTDQFRMTVHASAWRFVVPDCTDGGADGHVVRRRNRDILHKTSKTDKH